MSNVIPKPNQSMQSTEAQRAWSPARAEDSRPDHAPTRVVPREEVHTVAAWRSHVSLLLTILVPALAVLAFCFFRLNDRSLGSGDESLYALATQGTARSPHWWLPMWNGKPYFMTAPLKLWLNLIVIAIMGESNLSFRLMDALSGCGTFLVMYLFALNMTNDRRVGALAVAALLGSTSYMFLHGPRQGVLDGVLLFFTVVATYSGWRIVRRIEESQLSPNVQSSKSFNAMGWAILGGVSIGCGFMTKSVAILPPLAIVGLYCLLRRNVLDTLRLAWPEILVCIGLGVLIPLPYYLGHCLFSDHACESLIAVNVVRRVTDGYINTDLPFFYLRQIFVKRRLIPPELFVFGLVWATRNWRRPDALFLLVWALLPLTVYSLIPSRLPWYIASSYPAFALLCGASLVAIFDGFWALVASERQSAKRAVAFVTYGTLLAVGAGGLLLHLTWSLKKLTEPASRIPYDRAAEAILRAEKRNPTHGHILLHQAFDVPYRELPYRNMLVDYTTREDDEKQFEADLHNEQNGFVITKVERAPVVAQTRPMHSYMVLQPLAGRSWPILVGSWRDDMPGKYFHAVDTAIFLYGRSEGMMYGWGENGEFPTLRYRWSSGPRAGILIDVDPVMASLGVRVTTHISVTEPVQMTVWVNQSVAGSVDLQPGDFRYSSFTLPPELLSTGANPIVFSLKKASGEPISANDNLLMFSSLRLELIQR